MANAKRDENRIPTLLAISSVDNATPVPIYGDPITHRLYVNASVTGANISAHFQTDTFTSTNNQTTFIPSQTLIQDKGFYVNGSRQSPSTNYSIIGGQYVLNSGVPAGCDIVIDYIY